MRGRRLLLLGLGLGAAGGLLLLPVLMFLVVLGGGDDTAPDCLPGGRRIALASDTSGSGLDRAQLSNAATIIAVGNRMGVPRQGLVVALAVASQESGFRNYANDGKGDDLLLIQQGIEASLALPHEAVGTDHGSLGVFQQQWPWWGTMRELMDPAAAAEKFYTALLGVPGWQTMPVTVAGQAVQNSAYPDAYADDQALAEQLLEDPDMAAADVTAASLGRSEDCLPAAVYPGTVAFPLAAGTSYVDQANWGDHGGHWARAHTGTDLSAPCGTPVLAATNGTVVVRHDQPWSGPWLVQVSTGVGRLTTWYAHLQALAVEDGQQVEAGQVIGEVGAMGNSTGCHLHFEVHPRGGSIYEDGVDPSEWLARHVGRAVPGGPDGPDEEPSDGGDAGRGAQRGPGEGPEGSLTLLTANVPFSAGEAGARRQFEKAATSGADVLLFQEVRSRPLEEWLPGWEVHQPAPHSTAIAWRDGAFEVLGTGAEQGFEGPRYSRALPWVALQDATGNRYAVVAVHLPHGARRHEVMRGLFLDMTGNLGGLLQEFREAGYLPVVGGDWNDALDRAHAPWGAVAFLDRLAMSTNWRAGRPCEVTNVRGGRIDGFGYDPAATTVVAQGCLSRGGSDHAPVWMTVTPRTGS